MELTVTNRSKAYPQEEQVFQYEILKVYKTLYGLVAQLVRAPPCHGGGHGFESRLGRFGILAQLGEHLPYKQRVTGSSPVGPI